MNEYRYMCHEHVEVRCVYFYNMLNYGNSTILGDRYGSRTRAANTLPYQTSDSQGHSSVRLAK